MITLKITLKLNVWSTWFILDIMGNCTQHFGPPNLVLIFDFYILKLSETNSALEIKKMNDVILKCKTL